MSEVPALRRNLGFLLALTRARVIRAVNAALAEHGLHARTYSVLALVCESQHEQTGRRGDGAGQGVSQRALAERLDLDPSQIVGLVDALQSAGCVERVVSRTDRRVRTVVATSRGRDQHVRAARAVMDVDDQMFEQFDADERESLLRLLARLAPGP